MLQGIRMLGPGELDLQITQGLVQVPPIPIYSTFFVLILLL